MTIAQGPWRSSLRFPSWSLARRESIRGHCRAVLQPLRTARRSPSRSPHASDLRCAPPTDRFARTARCFPFTLKQKQVPGDSRQAPGSDSIAAAQVLHLEKAGRIELGVDLPLELARGAVLGLHIDH